MGMFPSAAELQRDRKRAAREARRRQRAADTSIERIERRLFALIERKTLITPEAAETLVPLWNDYSSKNRDLEHALADFIAIVSI